MKKWLLIIALGCVPGLAWGQGAQIRDTAIRPTATIPGASVRVCTETATGTPCSPLASIYADKELTLLDADSTVTADARGNYTFFAQPGCYLVQISAAGFSTLTQTVCTSGVSSGDLLATAFGARGGARKFTDITLTSGSSTLQTATANSFTAADVGSKISCINFGANENAVFDVVSITDATHLVMSGNSTFTSTANATCIIGPDDTVGIQAAATAAWAQHRSLILPAGGVLIGSAIPVFDAANKPRNLSIIGQGIDNTVIYPRSDFNWASCTVLSNSCLGGAINGGYVHYSDFSVDGYGTKWVNYGTVPSGVILLGLGNGEHQRLKIVNFVQPNAGGPLHCVAGSGSPLKVYSLEIANCHWGAQFSGSYIQVYGSMFQNAPGPGTDGWNLKLLNAIQFYMAGGLIDEGLPNTAVLRIVNSQDVTFQGIRQIGGTNGTSISVDGTSTVNIYGSQIDVNGATGVGMTVASGGIVRLRDTQFVVTGGGNPIANSGTVLDEGGNNIPSVTGNPVSGTFVVGTGQYASLNAAQAACGANPCDILIRGTSSIASQVVFNNPVNLTFSPNSHLTVTSGVGAAPAIVFNSNFHVRGAYNNQLSTGSNGCLGTSDIVAGSGFTNYLIQYGTSSFYQTEGSSIEDICLDGNGITASGIHAVGQTFFIVTRNVNFANLITGWDVDGTISSSLHEGHNADLLQFYNNTTGLKLRSSFGGSTSFGNWAVGSIYCNLISASQTCISNDAYATLYASSIQFLKIWYTANSDKGIVSGNHWQNTVITKADFEVFACAGPSQCTGTVGMDFAGGFQYPIVLSQSYNGYPQYDDASLPVNQRLVTDKTGGAGQKNQLYAGSLLLQGGNATNPTLARLGGSNSGFYWDDLEVPCVSASGAVRTCWNSTSATVYVPMNTESIVPNALGKVLGSASFPWSGMFIGSSGSANTNFSSLATGLRVVNLPDATGTLPLPNLVQTWTASQKFSTGEPLTDICGAIAGTPGSAGAACDGSTDDATAINNAIATVGARTSGRGSSGGLFIPDNKTLSIGSPIISHVADLRLYGVSKKGSVIAANAAAFRGPMFVQTPPAALYAVLPTGAALLTGSGSSYLGDATANYWLDIRMCKECGELNGLGAFTAETTFNVTSTAARNGLLSSSSRADSIDGYIIAFAMWTETDASLRCILRTSAGLSDIQGGTVTTSTNQHAALSWDGTTVRCFLNGTQVASTARSGTLAQKPYQPVRIGPDEGNFPDNGVENANNPAGRLDGVRLSNIARYTSGFTPPTAKWGAPDANTLIQCNFDSQPDIFTVCRDSANRPVYLPVIRNHANFTTGLHLAHLTLDTTSTAEAPFISGANDMDIDDVYLKVAHNGLLLEYNSYNAHIKGLDCLLDANTARWCLATGGSSGIAHYEYLKSTGNPFYHFFFSPPSGSYGPIFITPSAGTPTGGIPLAFRGAGSQSVITAHDVTVNSENGATMGATIVLDGIDSATVIGGAYDTSDTGATAGYQVEGGGTYNFLGPRFNNTATSPTQIFNILGTPTGGVNVMGLYTSATPNNLVNSAGQKYFNKIDAIRDTVVTFSATPTFNAFLSSNFKITLTDNVTSSTLSNATAGQVLTFQICQDATGSRTFVWPTNVKGPTTIGSTLSTCSAQSFKFDGTNAYALAAGVINQ